MPGYTTPTTKARICRDKAAGLHEAEIAEKFGLHRTTVVRIVKKYAKSEAYYDVKPKSGRPRKFKANDVRMAVRALARTDAHDVADLQRKYFPDINAQTIRTRLQACGLRAYVRRTKPFLTEAHKQKRLEWAEAHADWSADDWKAVVFSDESKFNIFGSDGRSWCWRRQGEEFDERYTKKVVKHGGGHVMVWGCITAEGLGRISRIDGNMDATLYVEILNDDFLGTLSDLAINKTSIYFQQDNDPKHTSNLAKEWFQKKKVDKLDWPANSPDMSIIEHVWDYLDRRVRTRTSLPRNRTELWDALVEEWGNVEEDYITRLYESMPRRVQALLDAKGGHTKY
jgi:transposase